MSENTCKWSSERTRFPNPSNIDLEDLEAIDEENSQVWKETLQVPLNPLASESVRSVEGQFQSPKIKPGKAGPSWVAWVLVIIWSYDS